MASTNRPCAKWVQRLSLHLDGLAPNPDAVEDHLRACPDCREWLVAVRSDGERLRAAFQTPAPADFAARIVAAAQPQPTSLLGRPLGSPRTQRALELSAAAMLVGLLVVLLGPVIPVARQSLSSQTCLRNLQEISTSLRVYSTDYSDTLPPDRGWDRAMARYVHGVGALQCPEAKSLPSYCLSAGVGGAPLRSFEAPGQVVLFYDEHEQLPGTFDPRHDGRGATSFLDGRAQLLPYLPEGEPAAESFPGGQASRPDPDAAGSGIGPGPRPV